MSFLDSLKHAFAVEGADPPEPSAPEQDVADQLCRAIVDRRLTVPALMFLEMSRPLGFIGAQAIHFFTPLVSSVTDSQAHRHLATFLERRDAIEFLCSRIEELESQATKTER